MYNQCITKAQELLDETRQFALSIKEDAQHAWGRINLDNGIWIVAVVSDFEVVYYMGDEWDWIATPDYQTAYKTLGKALAA